MARIRLVAVATSPVVTVGYTAVGFRFYIFYYCMHSNRLITEKCIAV